MTRPPTHRDPPFGAGLLTLLLVACAPDGKAAEYRPPDDLPRFTAAPSAVPGLELVRDFDAAGDVLYLLDPYQARVVILRMAADGMVPVGGFGRRGSGPGELQTPTGVAVSPARDRVLVADGPLLHHFSGTGQFVRTIRVTAPCEFGRPRVAVLQDGVLLEGVCHRNGQLQAVLLWSGDLTNFREIAHDVRLSDDGSVNLLAATSGLSDGGSHHLFGVGGTDCLYRVEAAGGPTVTAVCTPPGERFSLTLTPEMEQMARGLRARRPGFAMTWPAVYPTYQEKIAMPDGDVLIRQFSADSAVLTTASDGRELMVVPSADLLACRRVGCLWADPTDTGYALRMLTVEQVRSLLQAPEDS